MVDNIHDTIQTIQAPHNDFQFHQCATLFQAIHGQGLRSLLYKNLENYLDDALNHHPSKEEHVLGVQSTLQYLQEAKLFCNPKKCEFHQAQIKFLGVDISRNRFKMDDKKITAIAKWECPTSVHGVQEFIG